MEKRSSSELQALIARKIYKEFILYNLDKDGLSDFTNEDWAVRETLHNTNRRLKPYNVKDSLMNSHYFQFVSHKMVDIPKFLMARCRDCYFEHEKADKIKELLVADKKQKAGGLMTTVLECQKEAGADSWSPVLLDCYKYVPAKPARDEKKVAEERVRLMEFYEEKTGKKFPITSFLCDSYKRH
jgi:hypothetical protein